MVVYDVTNEESFGNVSLWISEVQEVSNLVQEELISS